MIITCRQQMAAFAVGNRSATLHVLGVDQFQIVVEDVVDFHAGVPFVGVKKRITLL